MVNAVELIDVGKHYGRMAAVAGLSFAVAPGETIALLGPSGCGKTTTLRIVAGFEQPDCGEVWLRGTPATTLPPYRRDVGIVFQNYALFPHMTVRRNVGFGLVTQGRPKAEIARRVDQALALVRLETQADKLPGQLSGGQQQRVAIARAIVVEPPLVLMDEPLSNLDAKLRLEMRAEIRRIHASLGCATIYVTHDQDEALSLADRIVVLKDGQTRQIGTPAELYGRPAHPDVAEFMGYRNVLKTTATLGADVRVSLGSAQLAATPVDITQSGPAMLAIRPEDLSPCADGPIPAVVQTAEYRGRDFFGVATMEDGTELYFRAEHAVKPGETLHLGADPHRILVYAA